MPSIHQNAKENNVEGIKELLKDNINVNLRDKKGNTPLHYAAAYEAKEVIIFLLNLPGVQVHSHNERGMTPLEWLLSKLFTCAEQSSRSTMENPRTEKDTREKKITLLKLINLFLITYEAIHKDLIKFIFNKKSQAGESLLHIAAGCFDINSVKLYLELGANVFARCYAEDSSFSKVVKEYRNDLDENSKSTASYIMKLLLEHAIRLKQSSADIDPDLDIEMALNLNCLGQFEETALFIAARNYDHRLSRLLIENRVRIHGCNFAGENILYVVIKEIIMLNNMLVEKNGISKVNFINKENHVDEKNILKAQKERLESIVWLVREREEYLRSVYGDGFSQSPLLMEMANNDNQSVMTLLEGVKKKGFHYAWPALHFTSLNKAVVEKYAALKQTLPMNYRGLSNVPVIFLPTKKIDSYLCPTLRRRTASTVRSVEVPLKKDKEEIKYGPKWAMVSAHNASRKVTPHRNGFHSGPKNGVSKTSHLIGEVKKSCKEMLGLGPNPKKMP